MKELLDSDDYIEECIWPMFKQDFNILFDRIFENGYTVIIEASNSDWRARTGHKTASSSEEILRAILDGNHFESTKIGYKDNRLVLIKSYGHDVPMGSSIGLFAVKDNEIEKYNISDVSDDRIKLIVYDQKKKCFIHYRYTPETFTKRCNKKMLKTI